MTTRRQLLAAALAAPAALALPRLAQAQQTLLLGLDASLAQALPALARSFEATRPGTRLQAVTGAAGELLDRLAAGTPFDLLAGVDAQTAASGLQRRLLLPETRGAFAGNRLVLVVPAALNLPVQRLADLARPELQRIAMGRPAQEPAGRYAREAINAQRLWPALQARVVFMATEAAVLAAVLAGDADAGFVYASSAAAAPAAPAGPLRVVETLPTATPIRYLAHVSAASRQAQGAAEFVQHLRSEAARAEFQRLGFAPP